MFQTLLAHPQEALHTRHWIYPVRVMSVGSTRIGVELELTFQVQFHSNPGAAN
jgi:hypothetical protein